jgi:molybdopterin-containing oxidoreductase family membrane subunit
MEIGYQMYKGIGVWGLNHPVGWAVDITSFVFWIGIGHAGTLISAILHLFRQRWRTAINRSAEAMTIFAVMTAGLFPLIHMGRTWFGYWLVPYPNWRYLWVNFRSPLVWDVFAVTTYLTISLCFWYTGLIRISRRCATARPDAPRDLRGALASAGAARSGTGSTTSAPT